jgi:hypothetical protein
MADRRVRDGHAALVRWIPYQVVVVVVVGVMQL